MLATCGCAARDRLPAPLTAELPTRVCEEILQTVPLTPFRVGDDAHLAFKKDEAALDAANGRITEGRNCIADVRERYAGAKPNGSQP